MTSTGRAGKRVDGSRKRDCQKRVRGDSFHGDTRGFMLERIYRVPGAWKNVYDQYTDDRAKEDLASCARTGTLPWSHKVVRYDKLGIASPAKAVEYALKRYHGFDERNLRNVRANPDVLPYGTFSALRDIRRDRLGKPTRYRVSRVLGMVKDVKRDRAYYASTHKVPKSKHAYDHRASWTKADKRRARPTYPIVDRDTPVYEAVRENLRRRAAGVKINNNNNNNNNRPPTRPSSRPPSNKTPTRRVVPGPGPPPPGMTPEQQQRFYDMYHFYMGA